MSADENSKPFVVYRGDDTGFPDDGWSIYIGGVRVPTLIRDPDGNHGAAVEAVAEAIAAAVEAREAKLRGRISAADKLVRSALHGLGPGRFGAAEYEMVLRTLSDAATVLAGDGTDYVPAAQLAAEQAKVRQLQAAIDALDLHEDMTAELVARYLEANGLKKPVPLTDDELLAEMTRRKKLTDKVVAAGMRGAARAARNLDGDAAITARGLMKLADALDPPNGSATPARRPWDPLFEREETTVGPEAAAALDYAAATGRPAPHSAQAVIANIVAAEATMLAAVQRFDADRIFEPPPAGEQNVRVVEFERSALQRVTEAVLSQHAAAVDRAYLHLVDVEEQAVGDIVLVVHTDAHQLELRHTVRVRGENVLSVWTRRVGDGFMTQTMNHEPSRRDLYPWSEGGERLTPTGRLDFHGDAPAVAD